MTLVALASPGYRTAAERRAEPRTELQLATDEAYRKCLEAGGHAPSGQRITRPPNGKSTTNRGQDVVLEVCRECEVPFPPREARP